MTRWNEAPPKRQRRTDSICVLFETEIRRVDLRAATPVRRRGRRVVQLIDLWVASLLPWDVLDLSFEIVGTGPTGEAFHSAPIGGLLLARAFVALSTHELSWAHSDDATPPGVRIESLVARLEWDPRRTKSCASVWLTATATR
jgi:hypothetical protein